MRRFTRAALATSLLAAAFLAACGGDGDDVEEPPTTAPLPEVTTAVATNAATSSRTAATTATNTATPPPTPPPPTATATSVPPTPTEVPDEGIGIGALDSLAESVVAGDLPSIVGAVQLTNLACTTAQGAGGPPKCLPGEAAGTQVAVLPYTVCEGTYVRGSNVQLMLNDVLFGAELHSAFRLADGGTAEFPKGTYGIVFETGGGGVMLGVDGSGQIINVWRGCNASADALYTSQKGSEVLLEP